MSNTGRCNCGRFVFEAPEPQAVAVCMCRSCTRGGGSVASNNAVVPKNSLKFTSGSEAKLKRYTDKGVDSGNKLERAFCPDCGSPILSIPGEGPVDYLKVAAMDDQEAYTKGKLNAVIFTRNALDWTKNSMLSSLPSDVTQLKDGM